MSRTFHEMTRDEQSAFRVWEAKLSDHTLSAGEHAECRRKLDELQWKGPSARVAEMEAKIQRLQDMLIESLNENLRTVKALISQFDSKVSALLSGGEAADLLMGPTELVPDGQTAAIVGKSWGNLAKTAGSVPAEGLAPCGLFATDSAPPHEAGEEKPEKVERRGRPKGVKNKPKDNPVATGEGVEQPATTVEAGEVTTESPAFAVTPGGLETLVSQPPASSVEELFGF
jgi:hypothetical protein